MIYAQANDLPEAERFINGRAMLPFQWHGAGVKKYELELFDHRMVESFLDTEL